MGRRVVHCPWRLGLLMDPVTSPGSAPVGLHPIHKVPRSSLA